MSGKKTVLKIVTCLLAFTVFLQTNAQNSVPSIEWQKCYGWNSWFGDEGLRISPSNDGNFITSNKKTLEGNENITISKIAPNGNLIWETLIFDNSSSTGFRGLDVVQTPDGGYLTVGSAINIQKLNFVSTSLRNVESNLFGKGYYDILVTKLNAQGQKEWFKILGGSGEDIPVRVLLTADNNLLLLNYSASSDGDVANSGKNTSAYNRDIWMVKLNLSGEIISKKCFGGASDELPFDMKKSSDGNYVIVGSTNSNDDLLGPNKGGKDIFVMKIDASLNTVWKKTYGGNMNDEARSVIALPNGDLIVGSASSSMNDDFYTEPSGDIPNNTLENIWLFKLNSEGSLVKSKIFGGSGRDILNDMILARNGNYIFVGSTTSNNGNITDRNRIPGNNNDKFDVFLMRLSSSFDILWQKTIGGSEDDEGNGLIETNDDKIITIGTTRSFNGDVNGNHANDSDNRDIWLTQLIYPCQTEIVTSADRVGSNANIIASDRITSTDRISNHSSVQYSASKTIDLNSGFNIEPGSVLEINLFGCTNGSSSISNLPIQVKINNECREGGMKFTFHPFTPDTEASKYHMSIQNLNPKVEFSFSGNTLITKNNLPDNYNAYYLLTVSREGYKDFVVQGYTSTCEHDGAPINCPENTYTVILDKEYYNEGDTFTAVWNGELIPDQSLSWYNDVDAIEVISQTGKTLVGRIRRFPAYIQAQPGILPNSRPCHGAVRVDFRKVE